MAGMNEQDITTLVMKSNQLLVEQAAHIKWICRTLEEMKSCDADLEKRVRRLEEWKAEHVGVEKRMTGVAGVLGAVVGVVAGVLVQVVMG